MPTRIDTLTDAQRARMPEWADRWIERGLRTGDADRARFEKAVRECYEFAGIPWHNNIVWVPSPIVGALASPVAALVIAMHRRTEQHNGAVDGAVGDAVRGAVDGAVRGAVDGAVRSAIRQMWANYFGGQLWVSGYYWGGAWTSFFREVCDLELSGDLWDRARAYEATMESACYWWPHRDFVMVCERPLEIHREQVGERGRGSHRLHREDGPAVAFRDGWGVYSWHGTQVPADLVEGDGWSIERILREPNAEIRRCAIEKIGWEKFAEHAGLTVVDEQPDPGNPGNVLRLCDVPSQIYGVPVRVLLCTNATPERDGTIRKFGLTVPADITDAVAAAAWTFSLSSEQYRQLERAT
jgi:hypothetical protein